MLKRSIALLLSLVFLLSPITICSDNSNELLGDVNDDGAINQYDYILVKRSYFGTYKLSLSETVRADVNKDNEVNQYDYILISRHYFGTYKIQNYNSGDSPNLEQVPNIVSSGKLYTTSPAPASQYEDTYNSELTDGVYNKSASYTAGVFSGYSSNFEIVVDLDKDGVDLNKFEISLLSVDDAGIYLPSSVAVFGSDTKGNWQSIGSLEIPAFTERTVQNAVLELNEEVSYRYIRFTVSLQKAWVFVDEVFIYSSIPKYAETVNSKLETAYQYTALTEKQLQSNLAEVASGKKVDFDKGFTPISVFCDYTLKCKSYDPRTESVEGFLTNGNLTSAAFEREVWVGIDNSEEAVITVDLGSVRDDVFAFALHAFQRTASSIYLPIYVDISVSTDGSKFVNVGRSYTVDSEQENYAYTLVLKNCINARYVRFTVPKGEGFAWFEEAEVYANTDKKIIPDGMYGDFDFETTATPSYWEQGSDYNTTQNLILNLPQQIVSDALLEYSIEEKGNTPESSSLLTDGKVCNENYCYNGEWFHFVGGGGRSIYYDFGHISSVSSFSVRFLEMTSWSIFLPDRVDLVLSEDGKNWYHAASAYPQSSVEYFITPEVTLDKPYRARYAMIYMDVGVHVFLDEITINGKKNISGASSLNGLNKYEINVGVYKSQGFAAPSEDLLGGVNDVCLIYHNIINANEDFFKPYVAYTDKDGNIKDTLFDGYLFLPSTAPLPSGGRPYGTNYASDWNGLFDQLFKSGTNFDALNKTAETTKNSLGLSELKLKVYVTIPHMDDTLSNFGDIDLDGDNESLTTLDGRVYVARAYAERVIEKFNSMNYENLELCGFYWFHEEISGGDVETSKAVNAMFDEIGYQLFWIPYFNASGFSRWKELGFDVCCYQPNYAFNIEVDESRIYPAVNSALAYGMCLEIEIDDAALSDIRFFNKYMGYLSKGIDYGYMDGAIHMYYQSSNIFGAASRSKSIRTRLIYDYTYQFIKGTLDNQPELREALSDSCVSNTVLKGSLAPEGEVNTLYRLTHSAEHGTVAVAEDGSFVYYPNKDFKGTDSFSYQYSNYLGWSVECTVAIEVE
ncbi:MAG: DUF4855 domain-containing protein [Clostridia bacterium]|nr:DUF4855 domain-containing protein [Clostridia bacterium]